MIYFHRELQLQNCNCIIYVFQHPSINPIQPDRSEHSLLLKIVLSSKIFCFLCCTAYLSSPRQALLLYKTVFGTRTYHDTFLVGQIARQATSCPCTQTHAACALRTQHLSPPHPYKTGEGSTLKLHEQLSTKKCFSQLVNDIKEKRTQIFRALASKY